MSIPNATPALTYLNQLLSLFSQQQINVPCDFRGRVQAIEQILDNDTSGLANTLLDFAINSGVVDFSIETSNKTLTKTLNSWLENINKELRGKVPTGVKSLAKEYYRERWKGSSLIVLRTIWEEVDGFKLPTKLWFVRGGDIEIKDENDSTKTIGSEEYFLRVAKDQSIPLPTGAEERIYIQKPYERWGSGYPTPYLVKRGVYKNLKILELLADKGANVIGKALEYLLLMKKGNEKLAENMNPEFIYTEDEMKQIKEDFNKLVHEMRRNNGSPMYTTHFDTTLEHLIPEYEKILSPTLYAPIERRIMSGLGFIEVVEGIDSNKKDSKLNPKLFIAEVQAGVDDYESLLTDVLMDIIESNKDLHRKFTNVDMIQFRSSALKNFLSDDVKDLLMRCYDRGLLSKRTMTELGTNIDFDAEVERRKQEQADGLDDKTYPTTMYPPVIQNQETIADANQGDSTTPGQPLNKKLKNPSKTEKTLPDRKPGAPETKTKFNKHNLEIASDLNNDLFVFKTDAIERAKELKSTGYHIFEMNDRVFYRPCKSAEVYQQKLDKLEEMAKKEEELLNTKLEIAERQKKVLDEMEGKEQ